MIQPYLQVAHDLQSMPEKERVAKLAEWANIKSLAEPTIMLCRMLIEKSDGTPLRRPGLGRPGFIFDGDLSDFPDEPLHYFKNVPFFAVRGYAGLGSPETAHEHLRYALSVGRWRKFRYGVLDEQHLRSVANALIEERRNLKNEDEIRRWVMSQIGPSRPDPPRLRPFRDRMLGIAPVDLTAVAAPEPASQTVSPPTIATSANTKVRSTYHCRCWRRCDG